MSGHTAKVYYEFMSGPGADDGISYLDPHALLTEGSEVEVLLAMLAIYTVPPVDS